jgi:TonB family protein
LEDQRDFFAVYDRYATDFESVGCHSSPGVTMAITASEWGVAAVATHEHLGTEFGCSAYLGHMDPPDSPASPDAPGVIACTSGSPSTPRSDGNPWPELASGPKFAAHDIAPAMKNLKRVARHMEKEYPRSLLARRIGGTALVTAYVCEGGHVRALVVARTSGYEDLDRAALRVAHEIEFTPAIRGGDPVGVWVTFPVTFTPGQAGTG